MKKQKKKRKEMSKELVSGAAMISANCCRFTSTDRSIFSILFHFIRSRNFNFSSTFRFIFPRVIIYFIICCAVRRQQHVVIKMFLVRSVRASIPSNEMCVCALCSGSNRTRTDGSQWHFVVEKRARVKILTALILFLIKK